MQRRRNWLDTILLVAVAMSLVFALLMFVGFLFIQPAVSAESTAQPFTLENFESYGAGVFPGRWRMAKSDARKIYRIEAENGNRFLRAHSEKQAIQIGLEHVFDPKQQQQLSWRWRAREFPIGADERVGDKHDTAAQVYVIFDNQILPRIIKYMWSGVVPAGAVSPIHSTAARAW